MTDQRANIIEESHPSPPPAKGLMVTLISLWIMPRILFHHFLTATIGEVRALAWSTESLASLPGAKGVLMRASFYKKIFKHIGSDVYIGYGTTFSRTDIMIGDRTYIGKHCSIGWVNLGREIKVADGARLISGGNQHKSGSEKLQLRQINIDDKAWVGTNAVIMADLGARSRVAAGAVVNDNVPSDVTVAGVPARPIRWNSKLKDPA